MNNIKQVIALSNHENKFLSNNLYAYSLLIVSPRIKTAIVHIF